MNKEEKLVLTPFSSNPRAPGRNMYITLLIKIVSACGFDQQDGQPFCTVYLESEILPEPADVLDEMSKTAGEGAYRGSKYVHYENIDIVRYADVAIEVKLWIDEIVGLEYYCRNGVCELSIKILKYIDVANIYQAERASYRTDKSRVDIFQFVVPVYAV